jgi:ferredoxin like protein
MNKQSIEDKLYLVKYKVDHNNPHIKITGDEKDLEKGLEALTYICPAHCYVQEGEAVKLSYENCLECGTCRIVCEEYKNLEWAYPRGNFGISYRFG